MGEMKKSSSDYEDHTSPDHLVVKEARAKVSVFRCNWGEPE